VHSKSGGKPPRKTEKAKKGEITNSRKFNQDVAKHVWQNGGR
jgi:hypothetical protein